MSAKIVTLTPSESKRNATSRSKGRKANADYRVREHLTEAEVDKLLAALKGNRHGDRDWLIGLLIFRHGLRVTEACNLRADDIDLTKATITVRRLKGSNDSTHYLDRDELKGLKTLRKAQTTTGNAGRYVFINERGSPFSRMLLIATLNGLPSAVASHFRCISTCSATPAATRWRMRATIRALFRTGLAIAAFSTRFAIPSWHRHGSRTFGAIDRQRAPRPETTHPQLS